MTLEAAFADLRVKLLDLAETFSELQTIVAEDKPQGDDCKFVELLETAVDDVLGWQTTALAAGKRAWQAVVDRGDLESARRALARCQEALNRLAYQFSLDLFSYERLEELHRIGRGRSGEWRGWAGVVGNTLGRCQRKLADVSQALGLCWQEVAERAGTTSVSVRATNVGQQILVPEGEGLR
jgi:hypothetical protein